MCCLCACGLWHWTVAVSGGSVPSHSLRGALRLTDWRVSQASAAHLVSIISPFHRLAPPNRAAWERAWLFHLPIIIAASPGSGPSQTGIPAATRCNWFWLMLRKGRRNKSQSRRNINKSESSSNYCIRNPARRWRSLRHRVKCDSAAPQSCASCFFNSIVFLHLCFESEPARCTLRTLRSTDWTVESRMYCLPVDSPVRHLPKTLKLRQILPWQVLNRLTAPCSQSGEHSTPPDGLTWYSYYHFAY